MLAHTVVEILVYRERIIIVLRSIHPDLGDVQVHAVITGLRNSHPVFCKWLIVKFTVSLIVDEIAKIGTFSPRSSSVRSSTLPAMTFHRQSTSEM
jgi:hypothetical protein